MAVSKENPFFAKAIANRLWSYFFGRGIIDPVDDIRASNPPVNPALLDALTKDFTDHNFDLQHLMRTIVNCAPIRPAIITNEWNAKDDDNFSHAMPRRLTAEQLMDAVAQRRRRASELPRSPPDTNASRSPILTSARMAFSIFSAAPRVNRPASASAAATSAFPGA